MSLLDAPPAARRVIAATFVRVLVPIWLANMAGAVASFVYLAVMSPVPEGVQATRGRDLLVNLVLFVTVVPAISLLATRAGWRAGRRATVWLVEDRAPTPDEMRATLRLPAEMVRVTFWPWLCAGLLFGPLQLFLSGSGVLALRVGSGILLGGASTCALVFLLTERAYRPLFTLVLAHGVPDRSAAPGVLGRVLYAWFLGSALPLAGAGFTQLFRTDEERLRLLVPTLFLVGIGLFSGLVAMVVAGRAVADPVRRLRLGVREVAAGRLDVSVAVDDAGDLGLLQAGFNEMVAGLRERRTLEDLFGRHVGVDVARRAVQGGVALGGEQREASVLFVDLIASTALAASRPPDQVVAVLNDFFAGVVACAAAEGGWVNKFEGDGALCVFGAPGDLPDHAGSALRTAVSLRARLDGFRAAHGVDAGIGVSSGLVTAGNVGAAERFEYTVIGDPVNEAARLTELAKTMPGRVLASASSVEAASVDGLWRPAGSRRLRGRAATTRYYIPTAAQRARPRKGTR